MKSEEQIKVFIITLLLTTFSISTCITVVYVVVTNFFYLTTF